ncbi:alpha/beta hydrolase [Gloeocapsopsis sp. IPPAS B-1203]|uniref:alpha/beta fold hydrolase n=1 Tax=Gloeocapsopsis sp. IPPAS B-1203 TaxID=2049454 RepID=UPI000C1A1417|nr:alpha/beta hydrolase [Gloeocapsopsis sp. IPPAS B-1203]PIG90431.1 alpha/beta hydrolase [Gloeocapsopsis sp. IPPAS B-1203]
MRKKISYIGLSFLVTVAITLLFASCLRLRTNDTAVLDKLAARDVGGGVCYFTISDRTMRYAYAGADTLPLLVLLHGAPGSSSGLLDFLTDSLLLSHVKIITPDRAGYGYSGFGRSEVSLEIQAKYIAEIIQRQAFGQPVIVMGNSYGGSVAARLAMDYPELLDGLLLISTAVAPGEEKIYGISRPLHFLGLKWLIPSVLRVANDEKMYHFRELEKMSAYWDNIKVPVWMLHGEADQLIYPGNALYAKKRLKGRPFKLITLPEQDHYIIWNKPELVKETIMNALVELQIAPPEILADASLDWSEAVNSISADETPIRNDFSH